MTKDKTNYVTMHYVHPTGAALAVVTGALYLACAGLVALWPSTTVGFFAGWFHGIDITLIYSPRLEMLGVLRGFVGIVISAYLAGALFAWSYNKCVDHCKKRGWAWAV